MNVSSVIRVGGDDGYEVRLGRGVTGDVPDFLPGAEQVLLVRPASLPGPAVSARAALEAAGIRVHEHTLPDAEAAKTIEVVSGLWEVLGEESLTRSDAVVAVGGGSVTDLGGFVAATWLRGVRVVHVPTTLLGMVDAAVGGKTGINTGHGKNLVGSFHPPAGVLIDLDHLSTLPRPDLAAGMAEVVKGGFIADTEIIRLLEEDPAAALDTEGAVLPELIRRKVQVKADVVTADLRESSWREILNYGHTFAHAIEQVEGYRWRHGDAVAVGMVYAAELAHLSGRLSAAAVTRHREVLDSLGLPTSYRPDRWESLLSAMTRDKKARGARLRFVILDEVGSPSRLENPAPDLLRAAYAAVSARTLPGG